MDFLGVRLIRIQAEIIYKNLVIVLFFATNFASAISASTLLSVDEKELSAAPWIGLLRIVEIQSSEANRPVSLVVAEVVDVIKGRSRIGDRISFEIPGGKMAGREVAVLGFGPKHFKVDAEYFVFLDRDPVNLKVALGGGAPQLKNWMAYSIERGVSGRKYVKQVGHLTRAKRAGRSLSLTHESESRREYENFVTEIYQNMN